MIDSNEKALNKHLEKQEQQEKFLAMFESEIQSELEAIRFNMRLIRNKSKDYYGYNFFDEANSFISDLV